MTKSRAGERKSLEAHIKDCTIYRKRTAAKLEDITRRQQMAAKRQDEMHAENKSTRAEEFAAIRADIAQLKGFNADAEKMRQKRVIQAQYGLIGILLPALAYAVWHILVTKGLT